MNTLKPGDKVRVRLECLGINEYRNHSGMIMYINPTNKLGIYVDFDNDNISGENHPFYEHELVLE